MLSVSKARELLRESADKMMDGQIGELLNQMNRLADFIFDSWKEKRMRICDGAIQKYEEKT